MEDNHEPFFGTTGPRDAGIVIVGEAWGLDELGMGLAFQGSAGKELDRILAEAGIRRDDCLCTNIVPEKPDRNELWRFFAPADAGTPELRGLHPTSKVLSGIQRLNDEIAAYPRQLVIACGNYPLWALSDKTGTNRATSETGGRTTPSGIMSWRGSMIYDFAGNKLLPVIHPAAILRQWEVRAVTVHDFKIRVPLAKADDWRPDSPPLILAPPTFQQAKKHLEEWLHKANSGTVIRLSADIETARKLITCIGFAAGTDFAMTIPYIKLTPERTFVSHWTIAEEVTLNRLICRVLTHPNILIEGQNFIYDMQYIMHWLGVIPRLDFDTMLAHHLCFPGTPKDLGYLSSLYVKYHWYWKDDGKEWDLKGDLPRLLGYNALDNIRTWEVAEAERELIPQMGLSEQWEERKWVNGFCLRMMQRGVLVDTVRRKRYDGELRKKYAEIGSWLEAMFPQRWLDDFQGPQKTPWWRSPLQQRSVFGLFLGMQLPRSRKTGNLTMNKETLQSLPKKYPAFKKLFEALEILRSIGVYQSTFTSADLGYGNRLYSAFNPGGTETFRLSSSINAFGGGANLQNIPVGDEE